MNELKQVATGILGSQKALDALNNKEEASILVVSDSHGEATILQYIIETYGPKVDALAFSGDGIGDLITILNKAHSNRKFMKFVPPVISFVQGNNDPQSYLCDFKPYLDDKTEYSYYKVSVPKSSTFSACGKKILVVHGNMQNVYYTTENLEVAAETQEAGIVIFGHTHCPYEMNKKIYLMNPGSIAYPRNLSKPGFAILQLSKSYTYATFFKMNMSGAFGFSPYNPEFIGY